VVTRKASIVIVVMRVVIELGEHSGV